MENYILGIDQSTQGTKALLFDDKGNLISRTDLPHRQIIDERGWVEHDPEEILKNTIQVVKDLVKKAVSVRNRSAESVSATREKQRWYGTEKAEDRYTTQSYGNVQEASRYADSLKKTDMLKRSDGKQVYVFHHIFQRQKLHGLFGMLKEPERKMRLESYA